MTRLQDIGVSVVASDVGDAVANTQAILHEIAALLTTLTERGTPGSIDLRSLPLLPGEYEALTEILGSGEVRAEIEAAGPTEVRETAFHGVWWVTHRSHAGDVTAEFIEVTHCPEILRTHPDDARAAVAALRRRLAPASGSESVSKTGDDHGGR